MTQIDAPGGGWSLGPMQQIDVDARGWDTEGLKQSCRDLLALAIRTTYEASS